MKSGLKLALLLALTGLVSLSCSHRYYGPPPGYHPPPRANYYHLHQLPCGHLVRCHVRNGAHHYRVHYDHVRYWHQHRVPGGYVRCYVSQGRHYY
jgi:hypothetical protein